MVMDMPEWTGNLRAAEGYLELGMVAEAEAELERIPAEHRNLPEVVEFRILAGMAAQKWALAAGLAKHMLTIRPGVPGFWINCAYSVRRSESVEAAERILLAALKLHSDVAMIHYNLACYAAVTGRPGDAEARLSRAFALDPATREIARDDADLEVMRKVIDRIPARPPGSADFPPTP